MPDLYDAHLHLQHPALAPSLAEVVKAMEALPIQGAVVNGTTEADWPAVHALASAHPWIIPAYGLHPWYLQQRTPHWEATLRQYLAANPRATVGEMGLDRWMRKPDPEAQRELFIRQLTLAAEFQRPASIHCLRAWGTLRDLLHHTPRPACGFLLHAYGGPEEMVDELASLGAYFSFSGNFLAPGRERKLAPFRRIPRERLLVETDAPSMPLPAELVLAALPNEADGTPVNHPANLASTYRSLAAFLELPEQELEQQVAQNFRRLFST